ncbi:hypothetical protein AB0Q95_35070 [Streptomyces sp. NPDC059900]|uniref:hypothetical protein n=1 Tax=Streptomyces sp. NPDC059900 TaxID=3155816 RepID=UPI0034478220
MAETTPDRTDQSEGESGENQPEAGRSKRMKTWVAAAVAAGLAAGVSGEAQGVFSSMVSYVKDWFVPPSPDESLPFTAETTVVDPWDVCVGGAGMVFLKPPSLKAVKQEFGKRWSGDDPNYWKESTFDTRYEAKPANYSIVNLLIQGKTSKAVVIERISVKPVSVKDAPKGLRLRTWGGCGDANMSRFLVDLDTERPQLKFRDGRDDDGKRRVSSFPYKVTSNDPETAVIVPMTNEHDYRFKFVIEWKSGADSGELEVGDGSRGDAPFEVVSGSASEQYSLGQDLKPQPTQEPKVTDPFAEIDAQGQ